MPARQSPLDHPIQGTGCSVSFVVLTTPKTTLFPGGLTGKLVPQAWGQAHPRIHLPRDRSFHFLRSLRALETGPYPQHSAKWSLWLVDTN